MTREVKAFLKRLSCLLVALALLLCYVPEYRQEAKAAITIPVLEDFAGLVASVGTAIGYGFLEVMQGLTHAVGYTYATDQSDTKWANDIAGVDAHARTSMEVYAILGDKTKNKVSKAIENRANGDAISFEMDSDDLEDFEHAFLSVMPLTPNGTRYRFNGLKLKDYFLKLAPGYTYEVWQSSDAGAHPMPMIPPKGSINYYYSDNKRKLSWDFTTLVDNGQHVCLWYHWSFDIIDLCAAPYNVSLGKYQPRIWSEGNDYVKIMTTYYYIPAAYMNKNAGAEARKATPKSYVNLPPRVEGATPEQTVINNITNIFNNTTYNEIVSDAPTYADPNIPKTGEDDENLPGTIPGNPAGTGEDTGEGTQTGKQTETGNPAMAIEGIRWDYLTNGWSGLSRVFPFCLPWDLINIIGSLAAPREAPKFIVQLPKSMYNAKFTIDLATWESIASLVRNLMMGLFIIGLIMVSPKLIKW